MDQGILSLLASLALAGAGSDVTGSSAGSTAHVDLRRVSAAAEVPSEPSTSSVQRKWLKYGLIGGIAGGVVGGIVGYSVDTQEVATDFVEAGASSETHRHIAADALVTAGVGATLGVLIGLREDHLSAGR